MSFLLDTDICSAYLKGDSKVHGRVIQYGGRLNISAITAGELFAWASRATAPPRRLRGLLDLLNAVTFLPVDLDVARQFGTLRAQLLDQGHAKASLDLIIAATAVAYGMTLVTHNVADFTAIPGLHVVDWLVP